MSVNEEKAAEECFLLTPTAEYLCGGKWHLINMTYNHDMGLRVPLSSGKVLLSGTGSTPSLHLISYLLFIHVRQG